MDVTITSFGYLHDAAPAADLTIDLRHHFRDPHVSPQLRYMTANDEPVRAAVLATSGIRQLVDAAAVDEHLDEMNDLNNGTWRPKHA